MSVLDASREPARPSSKLDDDDGDIMDQSRSASRDRRVIPNYLNNSYLPSTSLFDDLSSLSLNDSTPAGGAPPQSPSLSVASSNSSNSGSTYIGSASSNGGSRGASALDSMRAPPKYDAIYAYGAGQPQPQQPPPPPEKQAWSPAPAPAPQPAGGKLFSGSSNGSHYDFYAASPSTHPPTVDANAPGWRANEPAPPPHAGSSARDTPAYTSARGVPAYLANVGPTGVPSYAPPAGAAPSYGAAGPSTMGPRDHMPGMYSRAPRSTMRMGASAMIPKTKDYADIVFCIDCTLSMQKEIDNVRQTLLQIMQQVKQQINNFEPRVAFVGYRDYKDDERFVVKDFTTNLDTMVDFVGTIVAKGGRDYPEDVKGGLCEVLKLDWKSRHKILLHIADAPAHGTRFHG
ncbi:hypothetical protein HDU96_008218, partial [Phlyctochytrium bullatum]